MTYIIAKQKIDMPDDILWPQVAQALAEDCKKQGAKGPIFFGWAEIDGELYAIARGSAG